MHRAREAGLKAINFPPPSRPGPTEYNDPAWEPFWSAAVDLDMAGVRADSNVRAFLGVNEHRGVVWFRSESLDELLGWLAVIAAVESAPRLAPRQWVSRERWGRGGVKPHRRLRPPPPLHPPALRNPRGASLRLAPPGFLRGGG